MRWGLVAALVMAGAWAPADQAWHFRDWEKDSTKVCYMYQEDRGHFIGVLHARLPREPDAGIVGFVFGREALVEPANAGEPVQLKFDTGTVRGYRFGHASGRLQVRVTTNALRDLFSKFGKATRLNVVSSTSRASYDLGGFADALETLTSCTDWHRL